MKIELNSRDQHLNVCLAPGADNPVRIQLAPGEQNPLHVTLQKSEGRVDVRMVETPARPIQINLSPSVVKEILGEVTKLLDLYDVKSDGSKVYGAEPGAVLIYDRVAAFKDKWTAVLPSLLEISRNGESLGIYSPFNGDKTIDIEVPTLVSQLANDLNYITQSELAAAIAGINTFEILPVEALPPASAATRGKIYIVPKRDGSERDYFDEYVTLVRSGHYSWELIGNTKIDLSGYVTRQEYNGLEERVEALEEAPVPDSDKNYIHIQGTASADWNVTHNLNKYPSVTVVDSAGTMVVGDTEYIDENTLRLHFSAEFSGKAYIN